VVPRGLPSSVAAVMLPWNATARVRGGRLVEDDTAEEQGMVAAWGSRSYHQS
jgi:hypothetical protein